MAGPSGGSVHNGAGDESARVSNVVQECDDLIERVETVEASLRDTCAELTRRREKIRRMLDEVDVLERDAHGRLAMQSVIGE